MLVYQRVIEIWLNLGAIKISNKTLVYYGEKWCVFHQKLMFSPSILGHRSYWNLVEPLGKDSAQNPQVRLCSSIKTTCRHFWNDCMVHACSSARRTARLPPASRPSQLSSVGFEGWPKPSQFATPAECWVQVGFMPSPFVVGHRTTTNHGSVSCSGDLQEVCLGSASGWDCLWFWFEWRHGLGKGQDCAHF